MDNYRKAIGQRLCLIRAEKDMTQEEVSEKCGITVEYYGKIERGEGLPSIKVIDCLHRNSWDTDFILIGEKTGESVFAECLSGINEGKKNSICRLLLYKMQSMLSKKDGIDLNRYGASVKDLEIEAYTPDERVKEIILHERSFTEIRGIDIASDLGVSERTVRRWQNGESELKTEMLLSIYEKYGYSPSQILYGELNSNSKCDVYYNKLTESDRIEIVKFAELLNQYL